MQKIVNYVNMMFDHLPKTKQVADIKVRVMETMIDKYEAYCQAGQSEAEALGRVISQFGEMADIEAEFGINRTETAVKEGIITATSSFKAEPSEELKSRMDDFQKFLKSFRWAIGIGVILCIMAVASQSVWESIWGTYEAAGLLVFFGLIAVAVLLFISYGIRYSHHKKMIIILSRQEGYQPYEDYFRDTDDLVAEGNRQRESDVPYPNYQNQSNRRRRDKASGVIMLLAVIIFLLLGFLGNLWHPGWVVFPVAGLIVGIINLLLD